MLSVNSLISDKIFFSDVPFCRNQYPDDNDNKKSSFVSGYNEMTITKSIMNNQNQNQNNNRQQNQYALAINESIRLRCDVQSNPIATNYYWTLNTNVADGHDHEWLDETKIIAQSKSQYDNELLYQIRSTNNYGKLSCWSSNMIGMQRKPCIFWIQKAGPPSSLHECSVTNKTTTSLTVECYPGDNGGSKQIFFAYVYQYEQNDNNHDDDDDGNDNDENESKSTFNDNGDGRKIIYSIRNKQSSTKKTTTNQQQQQQLKTANIIGSDDGIENVKINLTSETSPIFYLNNLKPGTTYRLELFARNERGKSDVERLTVTTLFTKNTKLSM